ncbi:nitroreductase family protein [Rathayibacter tritici]|nr:nitroreductase family protein [Rathayibacter tritici]
MADLRAETQETEKILAGIRQNVAGSIDDGALVRGMRDRSATMHFAPNPISRRSLEDLVWAMRSMDQALWGDLAAELQLRVLIASRNVEDLGNGLFEYRDEVFERIDQTETALHMRKLVLQPEFVEASAILLVVGPLAGTLDRYGAHGHRLLLTRGGAACEAAWLTAVDGGLAGSIFAGFIPSALRTLAHIDGYRDLQLLALAIGHPA